MQHHPPPQGGPSGDHRGPWPIVAAVASVIAILALLALLLPNLMGDETPPGETAETPDLTDDREDVEDEDVDEPAGDETPTEPTDRTEDDSSDATLQGEATLSGADIGAHNTGPTAYFDPDLGRTLTYEDLEPSDSVTTTHDGQVIEKLDIEGNVQIAHDNVTVRAVRIRDNGQRYSISYADDSDAEGALVEYVEIDGQGSTDSIGVLLENFTLRRSQIYGQRTGVQFRSDSVIEENYVHSQATDSETHNTAMSIHGGSHVAVLDNNLEGSTSSALSLYPRLAPLEDILVEGNLFNGGSYCTYAGDTDNHEYRDENRGIRYIGNLFGTSLHPECGEYGPVAAFDSDQPGNEWRGNTWLDTGEPAP